MKVPAIQAFIALVKETKTVWALTASNEEEWLVIESQTTPNKEVFLLWSSADNARATCTDEWADYIPTPIALQEYVDFWVEELGNDNVLIGLDWADEAQNEGQNKAKNEEVGVVALAQEMIESGAHQDS